MQRNSKRCKMLQKKQPRAKMTRRKKQPLLTIKALKRLTPTQAVVVSRAVGLGKTTKVIQMKPKRVRKKKIMKFPNQWASRRNRLDHLKLGRQTLKKS